MSECDHGGAEFTVTWTIQVTARVPEEAARKALEMQRDYTSTAKVFSVTAPENSLWNAEVDLHEGTVKWAGAEAEPLYFTADRQPVTLGGIYWDNNLELVRVTQIGHHAEHDYNTHQDVIWHRADRINPAKGGGGSYDGSRLAVRHPFSRQLALEAAAELRIPCTFPGCTGVFSPLDAGKVMQEDGSVLSGWTFSPDEGDVPVHDHKIA